MQLVGIRLQGRLQTGMVIGKIVARRYGWNWLLRGHGSSHNRHEFVHHRYFRNCGGVEPWSIVVMVMPDKGGNLWVNGGEGGAGT